MNKFVLGADIGGTKVQVGLVNAQYRILATKQFPLRRRNGQEALSGIQQAVAELFSPAVKTIGVGITGVVDHKTGWSKGSVNLPHDWRQVPLKNILQKKFKVPVTIDNDAHCLALAEAIVGAGKNFKVVLSITLGTGTGSGLIVDKKIYRGAHNIMEFGHTSLSGKPPRCSCGRLGHFESLVSGPAMSKLYRALTSQTKNPFQIEGEYYLGKKLARRTLTSMSFYLAVGLANAIHAYNPDIIVLGGGLSRVKPLVRQALRHLPDLLVYPELRQTKIVVSRLGYAAGVIGAALITEHKY